MACFENRAAEYFTSRDAKEHLAKSTPVPLDELADKLGRTDRNNSNCQETVGQACSTDEKEIPRYLREKESALMETLEGLELPGEDQPVSGNSRLAHIA